MTPIAMAGMVQASVVSMLTAFARALDAFPPPMAFPPTYRDLAYAVCEGFAEGVRSGSLREIAGSLAVPTV